LFPPLAMWSRKGKTLSGGEQQMLTMARRASAPSPKLSLIDEPTEAHARVRRTIGRTSHEDPAPGRRG